MSKLDDAFLKAYAKDRGKVAPAQPIVAEPVKQTPEIEEGEIWIDADGSRFVRPDDGVMNVASFIARTSNGRTRGTATPGGDNIPNPETPDYPHVPEWQSGGNGPSHPVALIDQLQEMRAPHFQPISVDLAALDVFTASATTVIDRPAIAARHQVNDPPTMPQPTRQQEVTIRVATPPEHPATETARPFLRTDRSHGAERRPLTPIADELDLVAEAHASATIEDESALEMTEYEIAPEIEIEPEPAMAEQALRLLETLEAKLEADLAAEVDAIPPSRHPVSSAQVDSLVIDDLDEEFDPTESLSVADTGAAFHAAWEVDRFEFESIVWDLSAENSPLWEAAEQLRLAAQDGLKVLAISSPAREQGRTTLAITMARMLAATGLSVVLVDGDIDRPAIADKLRMEIRLGWGDAVRTGLSSEEVAVHSVEDGFTVLPLAAPDGAKGLRPDAKSVSGMIDQLRKAFDLVVIDSANINVIGGWIPGADSPCQIDAALVIQDTRVDDPDAMQACLRRLNKIGIEHIGLVENFS